MDLKRLAGGLALMEKLNQKDFCFMDVMLLHMVNNMEALPLTKIGMKRAALVDSPDKMLRSFYFNTM